MRVEPVLKDQYLVARIYFGCLMGMILIESLLVLPQYIMALIRRGYVKKSPASHNPVSVLLHKLSTLPSPVPFLTAHSYPTYLRFLVFSALNILFGYNRVKFTTDYTLYGWLVLANAGFALLLSPRGCNLISALLRVPTDTLLTYHRWAGLACAIHATLHFGYTAAHNARTGQLDRVLGNDVYQAGLVAWAALLLVFLTSLRLVRRLAFEAFYYSHFLFLVFAAAAMYHAEHAKEFFVPGLALWAVDRAWRLRHLVRSVEVASVEHFEGGVTKVTVRGVKPRAPAQIAWVQFPAVSRVVWHPFTIASAPGGDGDDGATFAIRGLGGYTKKVQDLSSGEVDDEKEEKRQNPASSPAPGSLIKMKVDGPHGVGRVKWGHHPVTILVAGGIGITPGISIASHIVNTTTASSDHPPHAAAGASPRHMHLLWILKDLSHASWFAAELSHLASLAASTDGKVTLDVTIHYTGSGSYSNSAAASDKYGHEYRQDSQSGSDRTRAASREEAAVGGSKEYQGPGLVVKGRPDILAWLSSVRDQRRGMDAAVSLCGPRPMIDSARKAAVKLSDKTGLLEVDEEVFEY